MNYLSTQICFSVEYLFDILFAKDNLNSHLIKLFLSEYFSRWWSDYYGDQIFVNMICMNKFGYKW